jgi:hypothetical protein
VTCARCGRYGHQQQRCIASRHLDGHQLPEVQITHADSAGHCTSGCSAAPPPPSYQYQSNSSCHCGHLNYAGGVASSRTSRPEHY